MRKKYSTSKSTLKKIAFGIATLGLLTFGGTKVAKFIGNKNSDKKEEPKEEKKDEKETFKDFKARMAPLTTAIMMETILTEGVKLDTAGLCKPYKDSKGIWTIGFGLTQLDGKPVTANTRHITMRDAWEKSVAFYEDKETYFFMWCYEIGMDGLNIDTKGKALCLASIIYNSGTNIIENPNDRAYHCNRNTELRALYKKLGDNVTVDQVTELFVKYPIKYPTSFGVVLDGGTAKDWANTLGGFTAEGGGIYWRRWLEGQMAMENIEPKDLLDLPICGMSDFWYRIGAKKSALFTKQSGGKWSINHGALGKFRQFEKNPLDKKGNKITRPTLRQIVQEIDSTVIGQVENAKLGNIKKRTASYTKEKSNIDYNTALKSFKSGDYQSAANQFVELLKLNPNDALLWNDLAASYNNLGEYDRALECTDKIFKKIKDKSQYAAAYYHAGIARENLGQYESALENYRHAKDNGNKSPGVDAAIARVQGKTAKNAKMRAYKNATDKMDVRAKRDANMQNVRIQKTRGHRA